MGSLPYNASDQSPVGAYTSMSRRFWVLLILSILMTVAGLLLGDALRVFANASLICLSCIGIQ